MLGGAMRQSGLLAAAALHALDHHLPRLAQDHENAHALATAIDTLPGIACNPALIETNILYAQIDPGAFAGGAHALLDHLHHRGIRVLATAPDTIRAVTSLTVDRAGIERAAEAFREAVAGLSV
jgi:threonine aldolase